MKPTLHPWEAIYRTDGQVYSEPFPRFGEVVDAFRARGCSLVLDIGCGSGRHVVHFAKQGFRALGLDISPTGLRLAQAWMREEGHEPGYALGDTRRPLPFRDDCVEGVFSVQVIHHARIAAVRLAIREIWRVLVPGGLAFVTVSGRKDPDLDFDEIEPGTFVPLAGPEAGLAHHIFTLEELRSEFGAYEILDLSARAEGAVLAVLARKP
ncbi:MAG: methyltransferase domain-containing protein [Anaerolineae bacterium]|nr:methyltransferase domain-containing protein [Anaerolineae bacterium]